VQHSYVYLLAGFGAVVLLTAWLPMVLRRMPLSLPMVCVALGAVLSLLLGAPAAAPMLSGHAQIVERVTEFVVIISLMGAGLKLDRSFGWVSWHMTWRMLGIAMPLTIAALTMAGTSLLGLPLAAALLLAAALAPTDPVLASDVQVGPPGQPDDEDEIRFTLTAEAGLNDGLAFPFVLLALAVAAGSTGAAQLGEWFAWAVLWKIGAGALIGLLVGRVLGWLTFHLPARSRLSRSGAGFVALGITCLAYGLTEMASGYGFVAVFVAALALRATERGHAFHRKLHDFAEELERLLTMVLMVAFGAALAGGGLLLGIGWGTVLFALVAIFIVRPLSGLASLAASGRPWSERLVISFFGIRGVGTFYYLAYGVSHAEVPGADALWSAAALIVLVSILLHGFTVTPVLDHLDRHSGRDTETAQIALGLPRPPRRASMLGWVRDMLLGRQRPGRPVPVIRLDEEG
jgi:sodium/hydrogen antiporter